MLSSADTANSAGDEIEQSASSRWESFLEALPRLAAALVIIFIGWVLARLLRWALHKRFSKTQTPSFARVMSKVASWVLLSIVVLIGIAVTFPSVKPVDLLAGLGLFSVAVGFAFQDILENTLSGMLLLFRQPFRSGDQITVLDKSGTVEGITIRETRITTYDGELLIIPNRDVYKNLLLVHTHDEIHRLDFVVGIAYENDAAEATAAIEAALADVDEVLDDPKPVVVVEQLNVSTVDIKVMFWSPSRRADSLQVKDAAIKAVKLRLDADGIEMPADIIALQATPSFKAALQNEAEVTPAGGVRAAG